MMPIDDPAGEMMMGKEGAAEPERAPSRKWLRKPDWLDA